MSGQGDEEKRGRWLAGWDWTRISVAALAVVAMVAGVQLLAVTKSGTTHAGYALIILGSVMCGAWIVMTARRDRN